MSNDLSHLNDDLVPPRASFLDSPQLSHSPELSIQSSANNSTPLLVMKPENDQFYTRPESRRKRGPFFWIACLVVLAAVVVAVIIPVYFKVIKPKQHHTVATTTGTGSSSNGGGDGDGNSSGGSSGGGSSGGGGSGGGTNTTSSAAATTGGDGSTVTLSDGSTFVYHNQFGGFWVSDPNDPFNNNAQPNSWTPPLNTSWDWGTDKIYGVNLGGWLVLEPFISPALFQQYPEAIDEWTLSELMAADTANGGLSQIEDHYNTFITEEDIAEIASAGLNWVRVPFPFWAIDVWPGEPFLEGTSWKYFLQLIAWCRKYGIRINLDLHTIPGSQNGYNHSGKDGQIDFLNGVMGLANAQRTLNYIRILTEFISQTQYRDVIPMFSIVNEALLSTIGQDTLTSFYLEAYTMMRDITGVGAGNGPFISIHDGFIGYSSWTGFLSGSDRMILDTHPYFCFNGNANDEPIATGTGPDAGGQWPAAACGWGKGMTGSQSTFGITIAGEFSNGYNDCGLYLRGVNGTHNYPDCTLWQEDSSNWNSSVIAGLQAFAEASMDALQNWFFWTWKIGNSSAGIIESPLWSYQLGFEKGWIPADPRTASGKCDAIGASFAPFDGDYESWQTGGAGAGTIAASSTSLFPFPPLTINLVAVEPTLLPTYTPTGTIATLSGPVLTPEPTVSVDVGNGWFDAQDTAGAYTTKAGCTYPDAWDATAVPVPTQC